MERTFSFDARAVVPTTQGFTSAMPSAGSARMKSTKSPSGREMETSRNPRRTDRAEQEVSGRENQIGQRESAAKAEPIGSGSPNDREKPHQAAKKSGEIGRPLGGKIEHFMQV